MRRFWITLISITAFAAGEGQDGCTAKAGGICTSSACISSSQCGASCVCARTGPSPEGVCVLAGQ